MRALIFAPLLFIIGCASQQTWNLNGQAQDDLESANGHCERFAGEFYNQQTMDPAADSAKHAPDEVIKSIHADCMARRGFTPAD